MKKLLLTALLLASALSLQAIDDSYLLPKEEVLKERLYSAALDHFADKTRLYSKLADRKMKPLAVSWEVALAVADYNEQMNNSTMANLMQMNRSEIEIIKAILQDHPAAIEELKQQGVLD